MTCEFCGERCQPGWELTHFFKLNKERPRMLCGTCLAKFERITTPICEGCGRSWEGLCPDCDLWKRDGLAMSNRAMYKYDDMMRWYFGQYKFNGGYHLRSIFQEVFSVFIRQHAADMYVPIPVSQRTAQTRGFNQVAGLLDFEAELDILACAGTEKAVQSMKTRGERLHSVQPFVLKAGGISVQNQTICLIDDVYTTGTTLRHAAQCFYEAGAKRVCSVTLAR